MSKCYIYVYLDPRKPGIYEYGDYTFDHEPFYVGKGTNKRAWVHLKENTYNPRFNNKIKKIQRVTCNDPHVIIYKDSLCDTEAYTLEEHMIDIIGRSNIGTGPLCNLTMGGIGAGNGEHNIFYGRTHTEETKQHWRDMKTGKNLASDNLWYGHHHSEETKKALSELKRGKYDGENNPNYGKHFSDESKKKMSDAKKGDKCVMYGVPKTEEWKEKVRETWRKKMEAKQL